MEPTPYAALRAIADRSRPLVTYYDGRTGERAELSVATLDNAIAKTANFLRDGLDLQPGARVALRLPLHWQLSAWLGACWSAGYVVTPDGDPTGCDACVVTEPDLDLAGVAAETVLVSLEPFGMPPRFAVPAGVVNHAVESRSHGDTFTPMIAPRPDDEALLVGGRLLTSADIMALGARTAPSASRVLVAEESSVPAWVAALPLPLATGGSVVLARGIGDLSVIAAQERVDITL